VSREECDLVYVPATMFCERCFAELDAWMEVPNHGMVFTYTILFQDLDEKPLDPPALMDYVKLDGADSGLGHYLGDVDPEDVYHTLGFRRNGKMIGEEVGLSLSL
jgi:uncharacterized OB-fold protein